EHRARFRGAERASSQSRLRALAVALARDSESPSAEAGVPRRHPTAVAELEQPAVERRQVDLKPGDAHRVEHPLGRHADLALGAQGLEQGDMESWDVEGVHRLWERSWSSLLSMRWSHA